MVGRNISKEFRLKNSRNKTFCHWGNTSKWTVRSKKHKYFCTGFKYIENVLILAFAVARCVSVSAFAFFYGIPEGNASYAVGLKTFAITAGVKRAH